MMRVIQRCLLILSCVFSFFPTLCDVRAEVGVKMASIAPPFVPRRGGTFRSCSIAQRWNAPQTLCVRCWYSLPIFAKENPQSKSNTSLPFPGLAAADTLAPRKAKSPTGAMVRSILFPGWGQLYNGKWLKALIVFGAEAGFIGMAVYYNQKAHDDQLTALQREFYADQRNTNYWRTGVVILLSMLDAFVDAHLSDFDESPDLSLNAAPRTGFRLSYKISF